MNPVQKKISCVYVTGVVDEPSSKRQHQTFRVAATRELNRHVVTDGISSAKATEKIDGTCCLVAEFEGLPWLWARHDRKPSKVGERRFSQYKRSRSNQDKESKKLFEWDPSKDFKEVPEHWMPALGLEVKNGIAMPDDLGHTPGWVPVQKDQRQHCWHLEAVDLTAGTSLVLRQTDLEFRDLLIESVPLSNLLAQTCELIGTNVNGNPYGLGSKKHPFHILVPHGAISLTCPDPTDYDKMWNWMTSETDDNQVEGVVWHCTNGALYKLHRHHLTLKWPENDKQPFLSQRQVEIRVPHHVTPSIEEREGGGGEEEANSGKTKTLSNLFDKLSSLSDQTFSSLKTLSDALADYKEI